LKNGVTLFVYDPAIHAAVKLDQIFRSDFASRTPTCTAGIGERSDGVLRTATPGGNEALE